MKSKELFGKYAYSTGYMDYYGFNAAIAEIISSPVEPGVSQENGGHNEAYRDAYFFARTILDNYIKKTEQDALEWKEKNEESYKHRIMKAQFLRTARNTIDENLLNYLKHPELFKKG